MANQSISMGWLCTRVSIAPLLIRVSTTNPCKVCHHGLKLALKKGQVATHGTVLKIIQNAHDIDKRTAKKPVPSEQKFSLFKRLSGNCAISNPVQEFLATELQGVEAVLRRTSLDAQLTCYCRFAHRYCFPRRYAFQLDSEGKVLTPARWRAYVDIFAKAGMEV